MARLGIILNNHLFPASLLRGFEEALLATVPEPSYLLMPTITTKWVDDDGGDDDDDGEDDDDGGDDRYKDDPDDHEDLSICIPTMTTISEQMMIMVMITVLRMFCSCTTSPDDYD